MATNLRRPAAGNGALKFSATLMPDGLHIAVESNTQFLADQDFQRELEALPGIEDSVEIQNGYTIIIKLTGPDLRIPVIKRNIGLLIEKYFLEQPPLSL
jgi:hypothetical protein